MMIMLTCNTDKSFMGKEIRKWCNEFKGYTEGASEIYEKYYSEEVKFKPNDKVYYFIEYMSGQQSYKECGSYNMAGYRLVRDLVKSPKRTK